jgi:hypothetical protein
MTNLTLALADRSWKELGLLAFIGFCFGLLVVSSINNSTIDASPTELGALATLGSRAALATSAGYPPQMRGKMLPGIGSSPLEQLAITAIEANYRGNRDVSANARFKNALTSMNSNTQERFSKVVVQATNSVRDLAGITGPMDLFDPLGFSTNTPQGKMLFYREVELKHGRVGMLAALGFLVGENFHPLFGGDIDVPGISAFQETPLQAFWPAVVAAIAIPEVLTFDKFDTSDTGNLWILKDDAVPGDLGFDPLGLKPTDPEEFKEMQNKELNNGRLAMIAAAGMIAQELATGQKLF